MMRNPPSLLDASVVKRKMVRARRTAERSRSADVGALDYATQWHEGPAWGSCAAATVILAKVGFGP